MAGRSTTGLLVVLAAAAGMVDALTLIVLGQVLAAAQSGNIVFLATAVGGRAGTAALHSGLVLGGFLAGAFAGSFLVERRPVWRGRAQAALGIEVALLVVMAAAVSAGLPAWVAICAAGLAMGVQSAVVARVAGRPATTYVTGAIIALVGQLADLVRPDVSALRRLLVVAAMAGGAATTAALLRLGWPAVAWLPAVAVAAALTWTLDRRTASGG
ncbi:YoaK family protein [Nonomuraea soli]|uniref:Uncharacterized membrane protein YoaK (UPF0700 family) n=1 Tax=Nonomuraea soli TaxID=1032476 RepID=A0A7W0CFQ8_9ACTN|nr:YoaK family protein [Nonomuraea soli]MBA2890298.1 uncharacterized membrane protein YoaK (UPF0700 family) [Nonomuraea soli]